MAMRLPILLLASLVLPASPVFAQVTIDLRALDQLPNARSPAPRKQRVRRQSGQTNARPRRLVRRSFVRYWVVRHKIVLGRGAGCVAIPSGVRRG